MLTIVWIVFSYISLSPGMQRTLVAFESDCLWGNTILLLEKGRRNELEPLQKVGKQDK